MSNQNNQNKPAQGLEALRQRINDHWLMRPDRVPSIAKELAFAVADIRQKLEEAAYGRPVTPETIHGRPPERDGDPLGRSAADPFRERCRLIHESREQSGPERAGPDIDR